MPLGSQFIAVLRCCGMESISRTWWEHLRLVSIWRLSTSSHNAYLAKIWAADAHRLLVTFPSEDIAVVLELCCCCALNALNDQSPSWPDLGRVKSMLRSMLLIALFDVLWQISFSSDLELVQWISQDWCALPIYKPAKSAQCFFEFRSMRKSGVGWCSLHGTCKALQTKFSGHPYIPRP